MFGMPLRLLLPSWWGRRKRARSVEPPDVQRAYMRDFGIAGNGATETYWWLIDSGYIELKPWGMYEPAHRWGRNQRKRNHYS